MTLIRSLSSIYFKGPLPNYTGGGQIPIYTIKLQMLKRKRKKKQKSANITPQMMSSEVFLWYGNAMKRNACMVDLAFITAQALMYKTKKANHVALST